MLKLKEARKAKEYAAKTKKLNAEASKIRKRQKGNSKLKNNLSKRTKDSECTKKINTPKKTTKVT